MKDPQAAHKICSDILEDEDEPEDAHVLAQEALEQGMAGTVLAIQMEHISYAASEQYADRITEWVESTQTAN